MLTEREPGLSLSAAEQGALLGFLEDSLRIATTWKLPCVSVCLSLQTFFTVKSAGTAERQQVHCRGEITVLAQV